MYTTYTILNPSGNTTALVDFDGTRLTAAQRKDVNDQIMSKHPEVEQVGFIYPTVDGMSLQMAGGEFCINASRAVTYIYYLRSRQYTCKMSVSGYTGVVYGEVRDSIVSANITWPLPTIRMIGGYQIVDLPGITHVIVDAPERPTDSMRLKKTAQQLMQRLGLQSRYPALGVMYVYKEQSQIYLFPVVYVRDIDTLIYETACGSGTIAASYVALSKYTQQSITLTYIQPSSKALTATLMKTKSELAVNISGPIDQKVTYERIGIYKI